MGSPRTKSCGALAWRAAVVVAAAVFVQWNAHAQNATEERTSFERLKRQYDEAASSWASQFSGDRTNPPEQLILRYAAWPGWQSIPAIVKSATAEPEAADSFELLKWFVELSGAVGMADGQYYPHDQAAMTALRTRHVGNPRIVEVFNDCSYYATPGREALLRECIGKGGTREIRGLACLYLGDCLRNEAAIAARLLQAGEAKDLFQKYVLNRRSADFLHFVHTLDADKALQDANAAYQGVIDEFSDVNFPDETPFAAGKPTLAYMARLKLAQMDAARVGQAAPELLGTDLDGSERKLSDYKGKVVVLHFWATWCGPCIEKFPQLQRLAGKHATEDFCVIGVNYDRDREAATKFVMEQSIPWPSWWAIKLEPAVMGRWFIDGRVAPSLIVLDRKGVLRHHGIESDELDKAIDSLLQEREADARND